MALNGLICADVPLRNYSLTHSQYSNIACIVLYSQVDVKGVVQSKGLDVS